MNTYHFSAWDIEHVKQLAQDWDRPHWVVPGVTDTVRWSNELRVKLGDRLASGVVSQTSDHTLETALRYMLYYREMNKGIWPGDRTVLECFVLDMVSKLLR